MSTIGGIEEEAHRGGAGGGVSMINKLQEVTERGGRAGKTRREGGEEDEAGRGRGRGHTNRSKS